MWNIRKEEIACSESFQSLSASGSPEDLGAIQGAALASQIDQVLNFYRGLFKLPEAELLAAGEEYRAELTNHFPDLSREIQSLSDAARQDERLIFALNARSEIFNNARIAVPPECTAVYQQSTGLLAQNWDWSSQLEPLVVDLTLRPEGLPAIRILTEPGIIGKIGMNSAGLGVCLNILATRQRLQGLPVHLLLRALLQCRSLAQGKQLMALMHSGKASHVLLADANKNALGVEYHGAEHAFLRPAQGYLMHTNHYLADEDWNEAESIPSSRERFKCAHAWQSMEGTSPEQLLSQQDRAEQSICKPYFQSEMDGFGAVGTVFSVIMDLPARRLAVRRGPNPGAPFYGLSVPEESATKPSQPAM